MHNKINKKGEIRTIVLSFQQLYTFMMVSFLQIEGQMRYQIPTAQFFILAFPVLPDVMIRRCQHIAVGEEGAPALSSQPLVQDMEAPQQHTKSLGKDEKDLNVTLTLNCLCNLPCIMSPGDRNQINVPIQVIFH